MIPIVDLSWHGVANAASALFLLGGASLSLSAAIGLLRFRDLLSRMHPSSKPQTLGLLMTMTAVIIHLLSDGLDNIAIRGDLGMIVLISLFALFTSPVIGNRIGHLAYREGRFDRDQLSLNDDYAD